MGLVALAVAAFSALSTKNKHLIAVGDDVGRL